MKLAIDTPQPGDKHPGIPNYVRESLLAAVLAADTACCSHPTTSVATFQPNSMLETCGSAREGVYLPGDRVEVSSEIGAATPVGS